jgi:hexosaminidase
MKNLLIALLYMIPFGAFSQSINVIPLPQSVVMREGKFDMKSNCFELIIVCSFPDGRGPDTVIDFHYLKKRFEDEYYKSSNGNVDLKISLCGKPAVVRKLPVFDPILGVEGYQLRISEDSIFLSSNHPTGIYRGICTLDQMITADSGRSLPCCDIIDYPSYSYRAIHLDVCRHFFSKEFIIKYIDQLAYYKINTFHWHLTDDQGWRIEIKKYPKLTEVGAWRTEKDGTRYGGYYTQDDIREIVAYAAERFITIIPEIEMPGHSSAALAAYPYLGCTGTAITVPTTWGIKKDIYAPTDTVFRFFEDVMDEVCALFPGRYIHIGGDEAPKAQWKSSPIAQEVMKKNKLKNEEELQHYFMHRVEKYLNSKGKLAIGWGEVVKGGLSDSIVVMSWLSKAAGIKAARHGNDVIMAPRGYCYFDYPQRGDAPKAFWMLPLPLRKVYRFAPLPKSLTGSAASHILGGEATLWTEYVPTEAQAEHQLMPRMAAMAEALWTAPARKDFADFSQRLKAITTP